MAVAAVVDRSGLHVRLTGWESVFGFARRVSVAAEDVVSVREADWESVRSHYGVRLRSAYLLRGKAGGWFLVTKGRQHLVWCWLHRGEPALIIRTKRRRPGQIAIVSSSVSLAEGSEWFSQRATQ